MAKRARQSFQNLVNAQNFTPEEENKFRQCYAGNIKDLRMSRCSEKMLLADWSEPPANGAKRARRGNPRSKKVFSVYRNGQLVSKPWWDLRKEEMCFFMAKPGPGQNQCTVEDIRNGVRYRQANRLKAETQMTKAASRRNRRNTNNFEYNNEPPKLRNQKHKRFLAERKKHGVRWLPGATAQNTRSHQMNNVNVPNAIVAPNVAQPIDRSGSGQQLGYETGAHTLMPQQPQPNVVANVANVVELSPFASSTYIVDPNGISLESMVIESYNNNYDLSSSALLRADNFLNSDFPISGPIAFGYAINDATALRRYNQALPPPPPQQGNRSNTSSRHQPPQLTPALNYDSNQSSQLNFNVSSLDLSDFYSPPQQHRRSKRSTQRNQGNSSSKNTSSSSQRSSKTSSQQKRHFLDSFDQNLIEISESNENFWQ